MVMLAADLDPELTDAERAIWETAHRFAQDMLRPAGQSLDKLTASDAIARDSVLWDVFAKYRALDLGEVEDNSDLSPQDRTRIRCIVGEELGWGDTGLALSLGVSNFPTMMAEMSSNEALIERFPRGTIGCWAITEPDHGSDQINFDGSLGHPGGRTDTPNCLARRDGNGFVISGQKSAWVSNGSIAEAAALFCAVDMGDGRPGNGVFIVPLNEGGGTRGKPTEKIGQRPLNQGEIFFDGLRVLLINAAREDPLLELAIASKVTATQAAFDVASETFHIFGGAGISRDCPIEKIFCDARISMIEDGCNEVLGMLAASRL